MALISDALHLNKSLSIAFIVTLINNFPTCTTAIFKYYLYTTVLGEMDGGENEALRNGEICFWMGEWMCEDKNKPTTFTGCVLYVFLYVRKWCVLTDCAYV